MNTEDVPAYISMRVPALAPLIEEALGHLKSTYGPDVPVTDHILGTVLAPLVSRKLESENPDDQLTLNSFFSVLEELMADSNPNMPDVIFVSFLEQLEPEELLRARAYMGERLRGSTS